MTDHYLADDADSRTVWNDGCIVPQIISLFRQRMAAALFVPYLHQQYADNRVFFHGKGQKSNLRINAAILPYKRRIISSCLRVGRDGEGERS